MAALPAGRPGGWGGYWGRQGPGFPGRRLAAYDGGQRMVFGAATFGLFAQMLPVIGGGARPVDGPDARLPGHRRLAGAAGPLRLARRDRRRR
jgi:hypothetical protein